MKIDFLDIGTCDFETSADEIHNNPSASIILVEPLKFYLDNIPEHDNITKVNVAISNENSTTKIFYITQDTIDKFSLPGWLRGCNSMGKPHVTALKELSNRGLPINHIKNYEIECITFDELCNRYGVTSIGRLKIDTEGNDHLILEQVLEKIKNGFEIDSIIFEYQKEFHNIGELNKLSEEFKMIGYTHSWASAIDVLLTKVK